MPGRLPVYRGGRARVVLDTPLPHFPQCPLFVLFPPPPPPQKKKKNLHEHCFQFVLGHPWYPGENEKHRLWKIGGWGQIRCFMENVKVAYWLEHKCNVLTFVQKSQGAAGDVKPVPEPEDSSPVKPANNSSGCVVSWTVQNHKHLKLGPNVQLFMRRTKVSELSSRKARRLAQLSSSEWVWIVKLKHALSVRFRR